MAEPRLRVVAETSNEKGDVLTRLVSDVFHSLGYEDLRLNVPRTGREIDISGVHKYERRRLLSECKAHETPIGGSAINKFAGAVQAEQSRDSRPVSAYFLSISGFTSAAVTQEDEFDNPRMVLMDGKGIVAQLEAGGILVDRAKAIDQASRILPFGPCTTIAVRKVEVVASRNGWTWGIYYGPSDAELTHVCFVHADGHVLSNSTAGRLIDSQSMNLLALPNSGSDHEADRALQAYREYVASEFGAITLDGLQADQEVGTRKFHLESLYVPTRLSPQPRKKVVNNLGGDDELDELGSATPDYPTVLPNEPRPTITAGRALATYPRLAILGPPGAGKSTLMKRLAVAYGDADRLREVPDELPTTDCVPIIVRCRQIGKPTDRSIVRLLSEQIVRAERPDLLEPFSRAIGHLLREGRVLILLDGLDEIGTVQEKVSFALQLRVFLSVYPSTRLVVTSREVGFRPIAGTVRELCQTLYVDELSDEEIAQLTIGWHRETIGASVTVRSEAIRLADDICSLDRVHQLASNPLMLTTLLLVRRWVGQLPRRRSVLYGRAVDVLLMTWNVEGHAPVPPEEALPQLGFLAYSMMVEREQVVSASRLRSLLTKARAEMPDLLMHSRQSIAEMIDRIEERSSLLIQSGFDVVDGTLQAVYEFRHLTFQEYLCARAIAEGWLAADEANKSALDLIRPYLIKPGWEEVIILTAALAGRQSSAIVSALVDKATQLRFTSTPAHASPGDPEQQIYDAAGNIAGCLADDVPVSPALLEPAIRTVVECDFDGELARELLGSRYEGSLREIVAHGLQGADDLDAYVRIYAELVGCDFEDKAIASLPRWCANAINEKDKEQRRRGLALLLFLAWLVNNALDSSIRRRPRGTLRRSSLRTPIRETAKLLRSDSPLDAPSKMLAVWAIAWLAPLLTDTTEVNLLQQRLLKDWVAADSDDNDQLAGFLAWALTSTPLIGQWNDYLDLNPEHLDAFFGRQMEESGQHDPRRRHAVFVCSYYLETPWSRDDLASIVETDTAALGVRTGELEFVSALLAALGRSKDSIDALLSRLRHPARIH